VATDRIAGTVRQMKKAAIILHAFCALIHATFCAAAAEPFPAGQPPERPDVQQTRMLSEAQRFNPVLGTQTFGASYQFTEEPLLLETAKAILAMGSHTLKCELAPTYFGARRNVPAQHAGVYSLRDLAANEPTHRAVLAMPFAHYLLWVTAFGHQSWRTGFSKAAQEHEYRELYDLSTHLLREFSGTGKTFYLGHWEGDGMLRNSVSEADDARVTPEAVQGMIDWLCIRQQAVDDAKRDTPHEGVALWHYTEVNHVRLSMDAHRRSVVSEVLAHVPVDFVSYSSYDTQTDPEALQRALSFIESKLQPNPSIAGRRVFIGEYGFPADTYSPQQQDARARAVLRAGLQWGCPFILYWELYNNEVHADGHQRGFWLIDEKGCKTPAYETHTRLLHRAAQWRDAESARNGGAPPSQESYRKAALGWLEE